MVITPPLYVRGGRFPVCDTMDTRGTVLLSEIHVRKHAGGISYQGVQVNQLRASRAWLRT